MLTLLLKFGVLVVLFLCARIFTRKPEYVVRLTSLAVPPTAYPEGNEAHQMAILMQQDPKEWLNRNPATAQLFRQMGYILYIIAGGGTFLGVLALIEAIARS